MTEASIGLVVRLVVTKRWPDGTTRSWARVAAIESRRVKLKVIALGGHVELARALEEARWRSRSIRVPATFLAQTDSAKVAMLQEATRASPQRSHAVPRLASLS